MNTGVELNPLLEVLSDIRASYRNQLNMANPMFICESRGRRPEGCGGNMAELRKDETKTVEGVGCSALLSSVTREAAQRVSKDQ